MTKSRKQQISLDATPFYHCVSRCVRRAFLCGHDQLTGRSYEHRHHQIEHDVLRLGSIFFIDVAAFAVLSNHLVLHVNRPGCMNESPKSIARRWHSVFSGNTVSTKFLNDEAMEPYEREAIDTYIDLWRGRLHIISWFMKALNEKIARQANKEDDCTGHFWESRFKSQALLDEKAVLSCMAYVDLNPIRAAMATTPEDSDHTSIQLRINYWKEKSKQTDNAHAEDEQETLQPKSLLPFAGNPRQPMPAGLPFNLIDYIQLIDWTGRQIRDDKRGSIATGAPPILRRLNIAPDHWEELCTHFEKRFKGIAGSSHSIKQSISSFGLTRQTNTSNAHRLFG